MKTLKFESDHQDLDAEELEMVEALDAALDQGSLASVQAAGDQTKFKAAAKLTSNPPKQQITTRIAKPDLHSLKVMAQQKGMPYQTLLASIVHQYVQGTLVEKS